MTELTIDQALQQGIEAHKAGQIQEADRLYTAILQAQPKHPDANHNMGVLAVSVGKVEQALPFFKAALEVNPATAQFWLSYIDALIKLDKLDDAKAVLDQAKSKSAKGDGFDKLEQRLKDAGQGPLEASKIASEPQLEQLNILDSLKLDQAIKLAKKKAKEGVTEEAKLIYQDILTKFPKNKRAKDGLKGLASGLVGKTSKAQDPPQDQLQSIINLYSQGQLKKAFQKSETLVQQFPDSSILFNIRGAVLKGLGQLDHSIEAYNKALAIEPNYAEVLNNMGDALREHGKLKEAIVACGKALAIKPDYAEAYNNMGNALQEQGKLEEAIETYTKALALTPDYAEVYNNMGIALKDQGKLEEAIQAYNKAIAIKHDYAEAYNNMGNTLKDQGKLEGAMQAYDKALAIKPDYAEAVENSQSLAVQLFPIVANYGYDFDTIAAQANSKVRLRPKYQIQNAIKAYLEADFSFAHSHNKNFKACDQKFFRKMNAKDKVFCNAYSNFIGKLLDATRNEKPNTNNKVYHLGESHCLSYAHQNIVIDGSNFRITPRITFGAKAFHFSCAKHNKFTAITEAHFRSLPKYSKVLLSFGEIDCRPNEGFISAAAKLDKPLEELIEQTTKTYVQWFLNQNAGPKHSLYFINVPAPLYDKKLSVDLNSEVVRTVALFNSTLKEYLRHHDFDIVDVFKFTAGREGFSNGLFHIDNRHLRAEAIEEIQQQLY
ncbi:tetratricopeptide repeat protein [Planktomarina temperata]|nr:tetratricopeptide repeat protein [Planktomarina temperata]